MKTSRFTETQILKILKEAEAGVSVSDLCREYGFGKSTFYKWKAKYGGMDASALRRMKELENVCGTEPGPSGLEGYRR